MSAYTGKKSGHFTPLRYPGGKGKLASFVKAVIRQNRLSDGEYVEPYAGGAAIALELLLQEYVTRIHINDLSRPIYSFWSSVLNDTDNLCRMIRDTPITVESWDRQKILMRSAQDAESELDVGFATFFLNRTNRSGILNAGIIGGRDQTGPWKIDARYNTNELIDRIQTIASSRSRISLTQKDALAFLKEGEKVWPTKTLIYLDPPYYVKGKELYYNFYNPDDHSVIAEFVTKSITNQMWMVSYDNVEPIQQLYSGFRRSIYGIGYSARSAKQGSEVMFFSNQMDIPGLIGPLVETEAPPRTLALAV